MGRRTNFSSIWESLDGYWAKTRSGFNEMELTYWGNFGMYDSQISQGILKLIWGIEILVILGIILYFFKKEKQEFLPEKRFVIFLLIFFLAVQLAIRFFDWRWFDVRGWIIIGQKGRYFFPALFSHILLIFIGLGAFLRTKKQFLLMLKLFLVLSAGFFLYSVFNVIIPRYYL